MQGDMKKIATIDQISKTIQEIAIVTMEGEQETVTKLSNGAISIDLE